MKWLNERANHVIKIHITHVVISSSIHYQEESGPSGYVSFPSPAASYGANLHKYVPNKHDLWTYER